MTVQVKNLNHIALRPTPQKYDSTISFYKDILGFKVNEWRANLHGKDVRCAMIKCPNGVQLEIIDNGTNPGNILVYFEVDDVETTMNELVTLRYKPTNPQGMPSKSLFNDILICEEPRMLGRTGFIIRPARELIEFFEDRTNK